LLITLFYNDWARRAALIGVKADGWVLENWLRIDLGYIPNALFLWVFYSAAHCIRPRKPLLCLCWKAERVFEVGNHGGTDKEVQRQWRQKTSPA
jgi:hypothetical protein